MGGSLRKSQNVNTALNMAVIINNILMSIFKILKMTIEKMAELTINAAFKILLAATTRAVRARRIGLHHGIERYNIKSTANSQ